MKGEMETDQMEDNQDNKGMMKKSREVETPAMRAQRLKNKAIAALTGQGGCVSMLVHEIHPGLDYQVVKQEGPTHSPIFTLEVTIDGLVFQGEGCTKKKAKSEAADKVLRYLVTKLGIADGSEISGGQGGGQGGLQGGGQGGLQGGGQGGQVMQPGEIAVGKTSMHVLNEIRPGLLFETAVQPTDKQQQLLQQQLNQRVTQTSYKVRVTVDGKLFEGVGWNKKLAKGIACASALQTLFSIHCVPGKGGIPVYTGDDSDWSSLKQVTPPVSAQDQVTLGLTLTGGKNPLMFLNELYPGIDYKFTECPSADSAPPGAADTKLYTCSVRVEDFDFFGQGATKKCARLSAAVAALTAIESAGILSQRVMERNARKAATPKWAPSKRAMFEQNDGSTGGQGNSYMHGGGYNAVPNPMGGGGSMSGMGKKGGPVGLRSAVMKLHELQRGLVYNEVSHTQHMDESRGMLINSFVLTVNVQGQTYQGYGNSKKQAKLVAAEAALRGIGQWTAEDERIKSLNQTSDFVNANAAKKQKFSMGGGVSKNRGGKWGRGYQKSRPGLGGAIRSHSDWVSGGVLNSYSGTPFISPSNASYGGNAAEFQTGIQQSGGMRYGSGGEQGMMLGGGNMGHDYLQGLGGMQYTHYGSRMGSNNPPYSHMGHF